MSVTAFFCSALEKIFSGGQALPAPAGAVHLLNGERGGVQLYLRADRDGPVRFSVSGAPVETFAVKEVYAGLAIYENAENCTVLNGGKSGYYPDLLRPADGTLALEKDKAAALFFKITADTPGSHTLCVTLTAEDGMQTLRLPVCVSDVSLPAQTVIHTDWFHADCLADRYGVPVFSEAHWRIMEAFMANAAAHGVNCLLTPLFTPPLDTAVGGERPTVQLVGVKKQGDTYTFDFSKLKRYIETAEKNGVRYFELSHLFTQWGAKHAPKIVAETDEGQRRIFGWETDALSPEYLSFLRQLAPALRAFTDRAGVTDRCFVHCSDEPGMEDLAQYAACAAVIAADFGCYRHIDALSDLAFFEKGLVETPVPQEGNIEAFAGRTPRLWTYYCCGQFRNELPNRFFCMPGARTRILGALLYKYDCEGFLHWGYNFYYTQHSVRQADPFTETDAGGAFPSGDAFVVYPGEDGAPLTSLRQQAFYAGLQDHAALRAVEAVSSRKTALALLEQTLGDISFTSYPMEPARYEAFRRALYEFLAQHGCGKTAAAD